MSIFYIKRVSGRRGLLSPSETNLHKLIPPRVQASVAANVGPWGFHLSIGLSPYSFALSLVVVVVLSISAWLVREGLFWSVYALLFGSTPVRRHYSLGVSSSYLS